MMPIKSTRLPTINKLNMISEFKHTTRKKMAGYYYDFVKNFLRTRHAKIRNDLNKVYDDKKVNRDQI